MQILSLQLRRRPNASALCPPPSRELLVIWRCHVNRGSTSGSSWAAIEYCSFNKPQQRYWAWNSTGPALAILVLELLSLHFTK